MPTPPSESVNDQAFCWEQIARTRPLFRTTQIFAPTGLRNRLLPLHALFSVVEATVSVWSDEELAYSKLRWWRAQLLDADPASSPHPMMRELVRTGTAERLPPDQIEILLAGAENRLDADPPADLDELTARCRAVHQPQRALETAVAGLPADGLAWMAGGDAAAGLLQLVRESTRRQDSSAFWWLPMRLLARHGIGRAEVGRAERNARSDALFSDIIQAMDKPGSGKTVLPPDGGKVLSAARHLAVGGELGLRKLRRMPAMAPVAWAGELSRTRLGDLFAVWKTARRFTA